MILTDLLLRVLSVPLGLHVSDVEVHVGDVDGRAAVQLRTGRGSEGRRVGADEAPQSALPLQNVRLPLLPLLLHPPVLEPNLQAKVETVLTVVAILGLFSAA